MITPQHAHTLARLWVDAWNRHDIEAILSHHGEAITSASPLVVERLGRASGTITELMRLDAKGKAVSRAVHYL